MQLLYGNLGIEKFSGMYGKNEANIDGTSRIVLKGVGSNLYGQKIVIEQFNETEYIFHLKERLDLFYETLLTGSLKNINKETREQLLKEIKETYDHLLAVVSPDKGNRISIPKDIREKIPQERNSVILKGNNNTMSLFLSEEDFEKSKNR